ncbi:glycosyltransferase [Butyrivibrio sp. NC3005]|uniref:glycosyltransferase n=1 Tax=Butyrivibrio sp. NC3005 TaxID=1280685 RepID=UPI0012DE119B|nr:glycosyltransferase [Butyrivibrio sp. NC3005]
MKISIICPVKNARMFVADAINSILRQQGDFELELIVVDGASTDGTFEFLDDIYKHYLNKTLDFKCNLSKFYFLSEKDNGMYEALVKGFRLSTGDVIGWLNADDYYLEGALSKVYRIFHDISKVKWITGRANSEKEGKYMWKSKLRYFPRRMIRSGIFGLYSDNFIGQESTFWRRELLNEIDEDKFSGYKLAGDFYLWNTFAKRNRLYSCDEDFAVFRAHDCNMSCDSERYRKEMREIVDKKPRRYELRWIEKSIRKWDEGNKEFTYITCDMAKNRYVVINRGIVTFTKTCRLMICN